MLLPLHAKSESAPTAPQTEPTAEATWVHAEPLHWSSVQGLPSSQLTALWLQALPLQLSTVQALLSSQLVLPALQFPFLQMSPIVQLLPSSQVALLNVWTHVLPVPHASSVHALPSLQLIGLPPRHTPLVQVSPLVHASPSLQVPVTAWELHTAPGPQLSTVQELPSSHVELPPVHTDFWHVSPVVQALPSLHKSRSMLVWMQPLPGLQVSSVQTFLSSQLNGFPRQSPLTHVSPLVHALPSVQVAEMGKWTQLLPTQLSNVQVLLSLQETPGM